MINLIFTAEQLSILNDGLLELPYKKAAPMIQIINRQLQQQFDQSVDTRDAPSGATAPLTSSQATNLGPDTH